MKKMILFGLAIGAMLATPVMAQNALYYFGHSAYNDGESQLAGVLAGVGCSMTSNSDAVLPDLGPYTLLFISVPGWSNCTDFFSADEKARINAWLADLNHRVVMIGEWDGFYGCGQDVYIDLLDAISGGTGIVFIPGVLDSGCGQCNGTVGVDPLVEGLDHVCKAATSVFDEGGGAAVAFTNDDPSAAFIVSNGTLTPCIVGIGDSNVLGNGCSYLLSDADTITFAERLCLINCAGDPVPTFETTWGSLKSLYR